MVGGIAERGRLEQRLRPRLPILGQLALGRLEHARVEQTAALELGHGLRHLAFLHDIVALRGEHVMMNAESREVRLDERHHALDREVLNLGQPCLGSCVLEAGTVARGKGCTDRLQVLALILPAAAGKVPGEGRLAHLLAERFEVAGVSGIGQLLDLLAGIVDVVLAHHAVAGKGEEGGERVAEHGPPRVRHGERARGIGRDIFDVHERALAEC